MPEDEKIARNCCWVEFDDGDSGEFPLQDVRLIPPDYPQEGTGKIFVTLQSSSRHPDAFASLAPA